MLLQIPSEAERPFRLMANTDSERSRTPVPIEGQHFSGARRPRIQKALIDNEHRAVDVARHRGISPAAVTAHLQKLKSEKRPL
jgi:hypothetical protein